MTLKVGDLVLVRPHLTANAVNVVVTDVGLVVSNAEPLPCGSGFYDVLLSNSVRVVTTYANLEVISGNR